MNLPVLPDGSDEQNGERERCGNGLEKIYPTTAVRFGHMKHIGEFTYPSEMRFGCSVKVIIKTSRGIEMGEQVSLTCSGCDKSVTREQIQNYIRNSGPEYYQWANGRILREATPADLHEDAHLRSGTADKLAFCQGIANRLALPIKVVSCEHLFGGERVIFYFLAEGRVDFRTLVKELAAEYQTRIEMRQVGVRDEARLLADYETCGRECCCKVFLKTLRPVSMKMAKMQKATLDPSKVSGRCGRLKCCLRYEHVGYEELDQRLPRVGVRVTTPHGNGVVVNRQILTQLVQLQVDNGPLITVPIEEVGADGSPPPPRAIRPKPGAETETDEDREPIFEMVEQRDAPVAEAPEEAPEGTPEAAGPAAAEDEAAPRRRKRRRRRRRGPDAPPDGGAAPATPAGP